MSHTCTVATYLKTRLEQLGLDRMFGVAGNYTAALLDTILEDRESPIRISGNPNEICAGFAADAYARAKGIGVVYVTYSVGAFTALNTIAGADVERVPVLLINGAPTTKENTLEHEQGLLYSHTTGYENVDIHMFRPITAAAERITNALQAPLQIDSALTALLTHKRPAYLEVAEDVWRAQCPAPTGALASGRGAIVTVSEAGDAARAAAAMLRQRPRALIWAGVEIQRYALEGPFLALMEMLNEGCHEAGRQVRFVTTALSKGVISESHPLFEGCVTLEPSKIRDLVGPNGCLLGLGGWTTSKNTQSHDILGENTVLVTHGYARVGSEFFASVSLEAFLEQLTAAIRAEGATQRAGARLPAHARAGVGALEAARCDDAITYDGFFEALGQWLTREEILVVDAGFPLIGAQGVPIAEPGGFLAQAAWLAIGYSVPAATGIKCARPDKRAVVVVGDGAFQETCQAVSDHHHHGHDTVVFVIKNGLYGIEQYLVNPNPFRQPPRRYSDALQNEPYPYNRLPAWDNASLTKAFGGVGRTAQTPEALADVLDEIRITPDANFIVEVTVAETNTPSALLAGIDEVVGEDETANPHWPPATKF